MQRPSARSVPGASHSLGASSPAELWQEEQCHPSARSVLQRVSADSRVELRSPSQASPLIRLKFICFSLASLAAYLYLLEFGHSQGTRPHAGVRNPRVLC